jgi:thiamine kinase-like enzyme
MRSIRELHESRLTVGHSFDIEFLIRHYVSLAEEIDAIRFPDIEETKKKLQDLFQLRRQLNADEVLCHGDFVHSNVLMPGEQNSAGQNSTDQNSTGQNFGDQNPGEPGTRLIDWEYSGMGDPVMDVSMFTLSAAFDRERADFCFRMYLGDEPEPQEWARFYLYIALGGFLWCMWGQYKQKLSGEEFGEYTLKMYRYMKDYHHLALEMLNEENKIA